MTGSLSRSPEDRSLLVNRPTETGVQRAEQSIAQESSFPTRTHPVRTLSIPVHSRLPLPSSTRLFHAPPTADQTPLVSTNYLPPLAHWSTNDVAQFIESHFSDKNMAQVNDFFFFVGDYSHFVPSEIHSAEDRRTNVAVTHRGSLDTGLQDETGPCTASARSDGECSTAATAVETLYKCHWQLN